MNKFWEWMKKKGYGIKGRGKNLGGREFSPIIRHGGHEIGNPKKQMLFGYKVEYCLEHGYDIENLFNRVDDSERYEHIDNVIGEINDR